MNIKPIIEFLRRFSELIGGLFLFSFGIVVTMKANIGFAPWDVFHMGVAKTSGLSLGYALIATGFVILIAAVLLGEKVGLGTLFNMVLLGVFMDLILAIDPVPKMNNFFVGVIVMIAGLFIISLGSFFYIKSAFGAGPRDSLMVALRRRTGMPVGLCRGLIEGAAVIIGWLLGGPVGLGTVLAALGIGFCVQITFSLLRFEPAKVRHENLAATLETLRR
jgi:uncharacterized membrane protein YczE